MSRNSPSQLSLQSRNCIITYCFALPKLWQIPTPCSTCLVNETLMEKLPDGSSSFRNTTYSYQISKERKHLFSSNSSRHFPQTLKIHPSIWIFPTNTSSTSPQMILGMVTFSSTFRHIIFGLISLEMIVDAFTIRALGTSSSMTFCIDVGSTPYSVDVL
jgi:hypothetical protein